jgi:KDO2-lipid IV(A) lauroyltransferase
VIWRGLVVRLGLAIAALAFFVVRIRRAHVEASLARAGIAKQRAWDAYRELGRSLGELLAIACGVARSQDFVTIDDEAITRIERARREGNVVLLCAHLSNWELVAMTAARSFPLALVVKPLSSRAFDAFITRVRARAGIHAIAPKGALSECARAHARGEVVATVIDQAPARREHGDIVSFMNAGALVDRGPAVMSKRAHATAFVVVAARDAATSGRVRVSLADEIGRDDIARDTPAAIMARATAVLEAHVRARPETWLWLHRRWKDVAPRSPGHAFPAAEKAVIDAAS